MSVITNGRTDQDVLGSIPVLAVKSFPPLSRTPPLSYSVPRSHIVTSSFHGTLRKRSHSGDMLLLKKITIRINIFRQVAVTSSFTAKTYRCEIQSLTSTGKVSNVKKMPRATTAVDITPGTAQMQLILLWQAERHMIQAGVARVSSKGFVRAHTPICSARATCCVPCCPQAVNEAEEILKEEEDISAAAVGADIVLLSSCADTL
ncbi:unnamed protein product [Peronospora belbahrii]|uniref:Uncharacterized protein n=1 Tax=Peronospora belbahrii TaxID=622444 RepID=A0ABN8CRR5_9STRA|nr:unnamed protein product [Peronospora belbahrii]